VAKGRRPVMVSEASAAVVGLASEASAAKRRHCQAKKDLFETIASFFFALRKSLKALSLSAF
jgi:hypothetical protein